MKKKHGGLKKIGICATIFAIGMTCYLGYIEKLKDYTVHTTFNTLTETAQQQAFNLNQELDLETRILTDAAVYLGESPDSAKIKNELLENLLTKTHFEALTFFNADGERVNSGGYPIDWTVDPSGGLNKPVNYHLVYEKPGRYLVAASSYGNDGHFMGTLVGVHKEEALKNLLLPFFKGNGITCIFSPTEGMVTSVCLPDNSPAGKSHDLGNREMSTSAGSDTIDKIKENMSLNSSGNAIFLDLDKKYYMHYTPAGVDDWYMITAVDEKAVTQQINFVLQYAIGLTLIMIGTIFALIFYIFRQQHRHGTMLEQVAYYDEMCGCPNLKKFRIDAQKYIDERHGEKLLLIKLDIDRFKLINQIFGRETGDLILKSVADALRENADGDERRFARAHDDEFYILHSYGSAAELKRFKQNFFNEFSTRLGKEFHYHIKFVSGVYYMSLENCENADDAIEKANIAHRNAKVQKLDLCIYDKTFVKMALRKKEIEDRMERALENQEFLVYLQPQQSLTDNTITGAEALVRWLDNENNVIYPNEFIPLFEENNFIVPLDFYMFEKTCQIIKAWLKDGLTAVPVSVNFARNHLADENFIGELCRIADRYQVPHHLLEVELTERAISLDENISLQFLDSLHQSGFTLSMDDFGTGYSSLGLLKNIPVDTIKIDKSFFEQADDQPRTKAVLINVIRLAKDLRARTIAEGVETNEISILLREYGCDTIQGYICGRPVSEEDFRKMFLSKQKSETN